MLSSCFAVHVEQVTWSTVAWIEPHSACTHPSERKQTPWFGLNTMRQNYLELCLLELTERLFSSCSNDACLDMITLNSLPGSTYPKDKMPKCRKKSVLTHRQVYLNDALIPVQQCQHPNTCLIQTHVRMHLENINIRSTCNHVQT